jgi:hypothetical protein
MTRAITMQRNLFRLHTFARSRIGRLAYAVVYLLGSLSLHLMADGHFVLAQNQSLADAQEMERDSERFKLQSTVDVDHTLIEQLIVTAGKIDDHLKATDARQIEQGERLSMITGIGTTVLAVLGILNLLGFIRPVRPQRREASSEVIPS